ncbi:MAG TPA: fibrobacter succinogenes major paralogous domain-containing protein [Tenuifilaceae bacterium]|nr:fibrobacter succinogenes major paralogous domain-containing protein [Tenuifilaceae bacterium]
MNCKHCKGEFNPPANVSLTSCPFCQKPLIEVSEIGDNQKPDAILHQITERFGVSILGDKRLSAILKDFMPHVEKKYQRIFTQAVADGVGTKLLELESEDEAMRTVKIHTLRDNFKSNNGFNNTADYVVDCFLFSLGWIKKAEEKETGIDLNAAKIIQSQLDKAMEDGCLSTDETALLFSFGSQLSLTEAAIATIVNDAITQKKFKPAKPLDKSITNPKEILCSCEWRSDENAKRTSSSSKSEQGQPNVTYPSVKIGKQVWMAKNLDVAHFRNGDPILHAKTNKEWKAADEQGKPAWCYYNNANKKNGEKYGKLYNWYAVNDPRGLAPEGWHVPTDEEWQELIDFAGGEDDAGTKLKAKSGWDANGNGTDEYGFSALPGGYREDDGEFYNIGYSGYWWSSTENGTVTAWTRSMRYYVSLVYRSNNLKSWGFSVRCVRDI